MQNELSKSVFLHINQRVKHKKNFKPSILQTISKFCCINALVKLRANHCRNGEKNSCKYYCARSVSEHFSQLRILFYFRYHERFECMKGNYNNVTQRIWTNTHVGARNSRIESEYRSEFFYEIKWVVVVNAWGIFALTRQWCLWRCKITYSSNSLTCKHRRRQRWTLRWRNSELARSFHRKNPKRKCQTRFSIMLRLNVHSGKAYYAMSLPRSFSVSPTPL